MDVRLIPFKVKLRLNKLDSSDYDNLECHQIVEAYNKAQIEWVRRQLHGNNIHREGAESTITRVDDLQILLTPVTLLGSNRGYYFESKTIPQDYLRYANLQVYANQGNCKNQRITSFLREEANSTILLRDDNNKPSFFWRETFHTIVGDKLKVYTDNDFTVSKVELTYYRKPKEIRIISCDYLGEQSPENVDPELNDDAVELIIDEAAAILAADIESLNQTQLNIQRSERNN